MRRWQPIALFAVAVLGLVAASGFVVPVRGQAKKDIAEGSYLSFEKEFSQVRGGRFFNMRMGKEKPDAKVIDVAARFYIKRFLAPDIYDAQLVAAIKDVNDEVNQCLQPGNLAVNKDFLTVFSAALVKQSREITSLPLVENAKNVLHLTQTFPTLGRLKQDSIAAYFLELVNADDAKHPGIDAIRIYAFRGLREFLPVSQ